MKRVAYGFRDKRLFQWGSQPLASSNKQLPASCVISFSFHRHGPTLRAEEFEHLIDLVEAERGLALFQFTHEAQPHPGFLGEVYLCQFIFLAHLLYILRYDCPHYHLILVSITWSLARWRSILNAVLGYKFRIYHKTTQFVNVLLYLIGGKYKKPNSIMHLIGDIFSMKEEIIPYKEYYYILLASSYSDFLRNKYSC